VNNFPHRNRRLSKFQVLKTSLLFIVVCLLAEPAAQAAEDRRQAAEHFWRNECASCHGQEGHGYEELRAPAIAGLPDFYFMQQVKRFREGLRGSNPSEKDVYFMHRETVELDDDLYRDLAKLVAAMKPRKPTPTISGNAERGAKLYAKHCASCHGPEAKGDASKGAPPLGLFQDWYVVEQIKRFKKGKRKADAQHAESVQMHSMAKWLWQDRDLRDLAVFVTTR
jgi:cytochrome c553